MSFVRPDLMARFAPWREVAAAFAVVALGLWLIWLGGYLGVALIIYLASLVAN